MLVRTRWSVWLGVLVGTLALSAGAVHAQGKNPCNPCGPKNPCGGKDGGTAVNPCHAKAGTVFYIADPMGRNSATFRSEAPLEDIVGTTTKISGYVVFDPSDADKGGRGIISLPVTSIDTGIPSRDEHLQSRGWLDAKNNPNISFEIEGAKNVKVVSDGSDHQTYDMQLVGTFSVHGKSKTIEIPARITYMAESAITKSKGPGDLLAGRASFSIKLSDYGVTGPQGMKIMGLKVSDTLSIRISFVATTEKPMMVNPCNPCGGKKNPCNPCGGKKKNPCNPCGGRK